MTSYIYTSIATTMKIHRETLDRLKPYGKMGNTWEEVINDLLDKVEKL